MKSNDSARRRTIRRQQERRTNPFAFNSAEWVAFVQQEYVLWPKQDRRILDRRNADRREIDRRSGQRDPEQAIPFQRTRWFSADLILNDEEKQMIQSLFSEDE